MKNLLKNLKVGILLSSTLFLFNCSKENETTPEQVIVQEAAAVKPIDGSGSNSKVETTWTIKRYIFNRSNGAQGAGHVGVGLEIRSANPTAVYFYGGAVENEKGSFSVPRGGNNSGWAYSFTSNAALLSYMKNTRKYDRYKFEGSFKNISYAKVTDSYNKLVDLPNRGYNLLGNNCMNATYDVLIQAGGVYVANPSTYANYLPNGWYNDFSGSNGWSNSNNL